MFTFVTSSLKLDKSEHQQKLLQEIDKAKILSSYFGYNVYFIVSYFLFSMRQNPTEYFILLKPHTTSQTFILNIMYIFHFLNK